MPSPPLDARRSRARDAWRGVRQGRPVAAPPAGASATADEAVYALVADPFESVADAHERLVALERLFRARGDRRGAFLAIYSRVTEEVAAATDRDEFHDSAWVRRYLVAFADLYRQALLAYETGEWVALPDPWQIAFESAARGHALVAQDAVLGINAHVNYDLALALVAAGIDEDRRTRYADHCAVNDVLGRLVDEVQDRLADGYAPGLTDVDEACGRLDEAVSMLALRSGRDNAWRSAVALTDSPFGVRRRFARWFLRVSSTGAAAVLVAPTSNRRVREALRDVERGSGPSETTPRGGTETTDR